MDEPGPHVGRAKDIEDEGIRLARRTGSPGHHARLVSGDTRYHPSTLGIWSLEDIGWMEGERKRERESKIRISGVL